MSEKEKKTERKGKFLSVEWFFGIKAVPVRISTWVKDLSPKGQRTLKQLWKGGELYKALKRIGVTVYIVPQHYPEKMGAYWGDYAHSVMEEKQPGYSEHPHLLGYLGMDTEGKRIRSPTINFYHDKITGTVKKQVIALMEEHLGSRYKWNGSLAKTIEVDIH